MHYILDAIPDRSPQQKHQSGIAQLALLWLADRLYKDVDGYPKKSFEDELVQPVFYILLQDQPTQQQGLH